MATWDAVISDITTANWRRGAIDSAENTKAAIYYLLKKGQIKRGIGKEIRFPLMVANRTAQAVNAYTDQTDQFTPTPEHVQPVLYPRKLADYEGIAVEEFQENMGESALEELKTVKVPNMLRGLISQGSGSLNYRFLRDSGSTSGFYGLPAVLQFDTGVAAGTKEATPTSSATYAGLSIEQDGLASDVPDADTYAFCGRGVNSDYDWVNMDSTGGEGALKKTTIANCLMYAIDKITFDASNPLLSPDIALFNAQEYTVLTSYYTSIANWDIGSKAGSPNAGVTLKGLPFGDIMCYRDSDQAAGTVHVINCNQCGINYWPTVQMTTDANNILKITAEKGGKNMPSAAEMFRVDVQGNINRDGLKVLAAFYGGFWSHPRFQAVIKDFS